jgi:hypothetical protein
MKRYYELLKQVFLTRQQCEYSYGARYHIVEEVPLSEMSIFQWKGKSLGAPSAHYVTKDEWSYTMLYMYVNLEEVEPYFEMFDKTYWK